MALEHATLTGSQLHEPKGIAAAAANRAYISDGAGSGTWTTITNSVLATEAKAFQGGLLHVRDQKASGTNGTAYTAGAWRTHTLNTVVTNEIGGVAQLAANQITLPAGTYWITATAISGTAVDNARIKLRNITDSTDDILGLTHYTNTGGGYSQLTLNLNQRLTIGSQKVFELQLRCSGFTSQADSSNYSVDEVYADVMIWKVG